MKRDAIWLVAMLAVGSVSCNGGKDAEIARLKSELEAAKKTVAAKPTDDGPKLWLDQNEDTRRVLQLLGYEQSFVIRWQHGELEGWIEVDQHAPVELGVPQPGGTTRIPINRKQKRDPAEVTGILVVALRRENLASDMFLLQWGYNDGTKAGTSGQHASATPHKIKMDPDPKAQKEQKLPDGATVPGGPKWSAVVDNQFTATRFVGQKEVPWLSVKLVGK